MPERHMPKASDEAAQAFYGQSESDFAFQIKQLTAGDPRLAKIFENTRKRYLKGEFASAQ